MQNIATNPPGARSGTANLVDNAWAPVVVGYALCVVPTLLSLWLAGNLPWMSNDDAMRLLQVRELLDGRGWFDHHQPRLGLEDGTTMHWSRLVDLPMVAIAALMTPILGTSGAEAAVLLLWPGLLLLVPLTVFTVAARRFAGVPGGWLAALLMAAVASHGDKFDPGKIDHHNVQIALLSVALCGLALAPRSLRWAAAAGAAMAASVVVGSELLPVLAALGMSVAVIWMVSPCVWKRATVAFALSLTGTLLVLFAATAPPAAYRGGYCDAISIDMALPISLGGLGLAIAAATCSGRSAGMRLAALLLAGGVALGVTALLAPSCFTNPYAALDPLLREFWLDRVAEARPLLVSFADVPGFAVPVALTGLAGVLAAAVLSVSRGGVLGLPRDHVRTGWIIVLVGALAAFALMAYQLRGAAMLMTTAVLPVAVLAACVLRAAQAEQRTLGALAGMGLVAFATPGVTQPVVGVAVAAMAQDSEAADASTDEVVPNLTNLRLCQADGAYTALAALSTGVVSASSNLGSHILLETPHRVLAAPYHRNQGGMIAQIRIERAVPDEARAHLAEVGADYVVICATDPSTTPAPGSTHPGLFASIARGDVPEWLTPIDLNMPAEIRVWSIEGE